MSLIQEALKRQRQETESPSGETAPAHPVGDQPPDTAPLPDLAPSLGPVQRKVVTISAPAPAAQHRPTPAAAPPPRSEPQPPPTSPSPPSLPQQGAEGEAVTEQPELPVARRPRRTPQVKLLLIILISILLGGGGASLLLIALQKGNEQTLPSPQPPSTGVTVATVTPAAPVTTPPVTTPTATPPGTDSLPGGQAGLPTVMPGTGVPDASPVAVTPPGATDSALPLLPVVAVPVQPVAWPALSLSGVVGMGVDGAATINGRIIGVGERIEGAELINVGPGGIKLLYKGETRFLKVGSSFE